MDTDYARPRRNLAAHSGDCNIFSSLINDTPECGICTCGYGWSVARSEGHWSQVYSAERSAALEERAKPIDEEWCLGLPGAERRSLGMRFALPPHGGYPTAIVWSDGWCFILQANDIADVDDESCVQVPCATRGQLIDLLAALKGGAS